MFMEPIQAAGELDRGDIILPAANRFFWKYSAYWPRNADTFSGKSAF
jgi:hypothetical protein